jgi:hypothetical protein
MRENLLEFENHENESLLFPLDSNSQNTIIYENLSSKTQFLIDKLSLKYNLGCCFYKLFYLKDDEQIS